MRIIPKLCSHQTGFVFELSKRSSRDRQRCEQTQGIEDLIFYGVDKFWNPIAWSVASLMTINSLRKLALLVPVGALFFVLRSHLAFWCTASNGSQREQVEDMPANPADPGDDPIPGDHAQVEQDSFSSNKTGDEVNDGSEN